MSEKVLVTTDVFLLNLTAFLPPVHLPYVLRFLFPPRGRPLAN